MSTEDDEKQLDPCLTKIIGLLKEYLQKFESIKDELPSQVDTKENILLQNSQLNNNVHTFTLNEEENELLDTLTSNIQTTLDQHLPHLSKICSNYLFDFLHTYHYDREQRKFIQSLLMGELHSFHRELKGLLASVGGYLAAHNGNLQQVKKFIEEYPTYKDKPGLWGTTLLYSAARNDHLDVVKYLIESVHCSVNAQNQRDVNFALDVCDKTFVPKPSAASTALHAACYNQHFDIVKYLVEHGADYFIRNQATETPIMNGEPYINIKKYFQDYLIINYSIPTPEHLPDRTIMHDERRPIQDCWWEYKPFEDPKWYKFTETETIELHKALIPTEEFQQYVYLQVQQDLYSVSMIEFYRSGKLEQDPQKNMAWIRCRGSSILNFDCYSIWQIMLIQHEKVDKSVDTTPSLKVQQFPSTTDSRFKLQLNTWYSCNTKTNSLLDNSMNYRRKVIFINIPFVSNKLKFNLQTFEFSNDEKTIVGFIRWIPKFISKNENDETKIVYIDNYNLTANIQPIPMTTKHLKEISHLKEVDQESVNPKDDDDDDDTDLPIVTTSGIENDDDTSDNLNDQNKVIVENTGTMSVTDLNDETRAINSPPELSDAITTTTSDDSNLSKEEFFHEKVGQSSQPAVTERTNSTLKDETTGVLTCKLEAELQELRDEIEIQKAIVEEQKQSKEKLTTEKEQELQRTNKLLQNLQQQLSNRQSYEQQLKNLTKKIKYVDYINIQPVVINGFLSGQHQQIVSHLQTKHKIDNYFLGIPNVTISEKNGLYCISVTGVQAHHDEFKLILQRIQTLSNVTQSAKDYYQRRLNATLRTITHIMIKQIHSSQDWKHYTICFLELIKNKIEEFVKLFDEHILQKAKGMIEQCIIDSNYQSWIQIQKVTNLYMKMNQFEPQLELLKYEALDEFIKQHISTQQIKFEKKPSLKSLQTMNEFIDSVKKELKNNPIYFGCQFEQLKEIPKLLERIMLYYRCFLLQLPLYESSKELLDRIENNTVITIATSTGSGKSSLLPALLIAQGYEKVLVTQPRRLPCTSICKRVNETMLTNKNDMRLAGWAVSGAECDVKARILYLTDGLLKERLLHDENLINKNQTKTNKSIVFFIDEVHERSINIDLCLSLIARLLTEKPYLQSKVKIIISSATLDSSVPNLFRKIPQLKVDEFKMPMLGTLYPVAIFNRPNENILDLVQQLCKKRQRQDQILCFVNSVAEVNQCCRLLEEISHGTIVAYPLIQSQSAVDQQRIIEEGSIFFSTTVAETSLTFPSLKYVIDTGMINIPIYDFKKKQTTLIEIRAAQSTIKQRLGRLGRTKPGEYYSLYDFNVEEKKYPIPQICQSELTNVEFSLRKSIVKNGLNYMKKFLPDPPSSEAISAAIEELKKLRIVDAQDKLTTTGVAISKLPDFGSLAMSKSVLSALNQNNCGRDLIVLSSILGVLNTSAVLKSIPSSMKSPDGDFMTLLNVMNEILLVRESVRAGQFQLTRVCKAKSLMSISHVLKQALRRYESLEKSFNLSDDYRQKSQVSNNDWELIAKSLLNGYGENVFVSMKELQGKTHLFTRYSPPKEDFAVLDLQSTLTRAVTSAPVALVLARDIRFSSSIRATAVLSFVGEIKSQWIEYSFKRIITLNTAEVSKLNSDNILATTRQAFPNVKIQLTNQNLNLDGSAGSVLDAELDILRQLIVEMKFSLTNPYSLNETDKYKLMKQNFESVSKMTRIFNPMIWRWEAQHQVKITVNNSIVKDECEITIEGRDSQNQLVRKEFQSFIGWLKNCAVIRHPNAGVSPRILKPQIRKNCLDIEEKISHITDSKRTSIELWKSLKGSKATRETRMEVVAWFAVCKFDCRLEGGFVRDWVVGNYTVRSTGPPSSWITYTTNPDGIHIPCLNKDLIPSDLDCHLPSHRYFDIDKFLDKLHKYQIECQVFREDWRYVLLLDENSKTGPFTMDLIEPHVALTHDRIDFDVSNLSLEKDYTKELGMRVDIQQKPYSIELETIVHNIKTKRFQVLRPIDAGVRYRIEKMKNRGWTQLGEAMHVIPNPPPKCQAFLVPLPESTELYKSLVQQLKSNIDYQVQVLSIGQIKNPLLEDAYLAMKQIIAKQCVGKNPNERELFHGTNGEAIDGILNDGFDDRYWRTSGKWGHGAYFADNPRVSHGYTASDPTDQTRIIYYNKVTLGKESILQTMDQQLMSAPIGYHSTHGKLPGFVNADEYIVYRYAQAMPYLKITYKA